MEIFWRHSPDFLRHFRDILETIILGLYFRSRTVKWFQTFNRLRRIALIEESWKSMLVFSHKVNIVESCQLVLHFSRFILTKCFQHKH